MEIFIIMLALIGFYYGGYMLKHLRSTINKNHEYYLNIIKIREGEEINFSNDLIKSGLPIIKMTIMGVRYNFLLDTGANVNVLDDVFVNTLLEKGINPVYSSGDTIFGSSKPTECKNKIELSFSYNNKNYTENFIVSEDVKNTFNLIKSEYNIEIVGILGSTFFTKHKMSLDFNRSVLWIK